MISTIIQIMEMIDEYSIYLESKDCSFDKEGFPILSKSHFLDEWPDAVVPFRSRNSKLVSNPRKTVLCFYCEDSRIYPRLEKVFEDLSEYHKYMGVISPDVTVTSDMDEEWQREIMLLNQLFMAVIAINGIKVALNLRNGSQATLSCFNSIPHNVMCASGTLGCACTSSMLNMEYQEKIMRLLPFGVLLYGKSDPIMEEQIKAAGISYRRYDDAHTIMKVSRLDLRASQNLSVNK